MREFIITNSFQVYISLTKYRHTPHPLVRRTHARMHAHYAFYRLVVKTVVTFMVLHTIHKVLFKQAQCKQIKHAHSRPWNFTCPIKCKAVSGSGLCSVQLYLIISPEAMGLLLSLGQKSEAALGKRAALEMVVKAQWPDTALCYFLDALPKVFLFKLKQLWHTFLHIGVLTMEARSGAGFHFPLRLVYCLQFTHCLW